MWQPYDSWRCDQPVHSTARVCPGRGALATFFLLATLAIASARALAVDYQPGSYVPVFPWPASVQALVGDLNQRVADIRRHRSWMAVWTANSGENVHMTFNDKLLDHKHQSGHYFRHGQQSELDQLIEAQRGNLKEMLGRAQDPANHLDFKGLSLVCDTSATQGVETELYLKIKFGLQDQARISRITGIRSNSWHISVGHFETKTSDTQAELNSILSHLNVLATDKKMIDLLKPQNPPVALKTIRIVRTDNVNAKYATYREIKSGRREHHEGRSSE